MTRRATKERFMLYSAGWKRGASTGVKSPEKEGDPDYEDGYAEGVRARILADQCAMVRFGISAAEAQSWVLR